MTLTAFLLWSWLFFHIACERIENNRPSFLALIGFYLCLGFACMSKGPFLVGIFSSVPLLAYLFWTKRIGMLARAGLWWGVPLSVAMGLSWFVALHYKGVDPSDFFAVENLARFFGRKDHVHPIPFLNYFISLPLIFAPWVILIPFAAAWSLNVFRHDRANLGDGAKLVTCALGISFIVMGLSGSKRDLYLLPMYPYLSLWVAWYLERRSISREGQHGNTSLVNVLRVAGVLLFAACVSSLALLPKYGGIPLEQAACVVIGMLIMIALFLAGAALKQGKQIGFVSWILVAAIVLTVSLELVVLPIHERKLNLPQFYSAVGEKLDRRPLMIIGTNANEASWYLGNPAGRIDEVSNSELKERLFGKPNATLLVSKPHLREYPLLKEAVTIISGPFVRGGIEFMLVQPNPAHPPDPALFQPRSPQKKAASWSWSKLFQDL